MGDCYFFPVPPFIAREAALVLSAITGSGVLLVSVAVLRMLPRVDRSAGATHEWDDSDEQGHSPQELPYHHCGLLPTDP